ncbi:hypothetical protein Hdeb2414_s0040g00735991 [Helianthus debilis subsp. tardiflorus]
MSAGDHAKMSIFSNRSCFSLIRIAGDMACPSKIVCSGYSLLSTHFSGSLDGDGFAAFTGGSSSTDMTSLLKYKIAAPVSVGKPQAACGMEVMMLNSLCERLPNNTSWRVVAGITIKLT